MSKRYTNSINTIREVMGLGGMGVTRQSMLKCKRCGKIFNIMDVVVFYLKVLRKLTARCVDFPECKGRDFEVYSKRF